MSEQEAINRTPHPNTVDTLKRDFTALGLQPGMTVIVHSSLSRIGWVNGGPVAVIQALENVLTAEGTLVMPTHSSDLSDPAKWVNPPVPEAWWQTIRDTMPAYDAALTPARGIGAIAETFRKQPGVRRSAHPHMSFAAWGRHAEAMTDKHPYAHGLGNESPLARVYDRDGWVLLLGVGHANNTSLHLAEYRADWPGKRSETLGAPVMENGQRRWIWFEDIEIDTGDFEMVGAAFNQAEAAPGGSLRQGQIGQAETLLFRQRPLVDFAAIWFAQHRDQTQAHAHGESDTPPSP